MLLSLGLEESSMGRQRYVSLGFYFLKTIIYLIVKIMGTYNLD